MLTVKAILVSVGLTFLMFFGIPSKIKKETWQSDEFKSFLTKYNKSYANETEFKHRFDAFKKSLVMIEELNANRTFKTSALYGITAYSDLYEDEFVALKLQSDYAQRSARRNNTEGDFNKKKANKKHRNKKLKRSLSSKIPRKVDWRSKGAITEVNNQYSCGACWAFSAIETVESMHFMKTRELVKLSTQQMIDCAGYGNNGCRGGDICSLLKWLDDKKVEILRMEEYPLQLRTEQCRNGSLSKGGVSVTKFACQALVSDEDFLLEVLAKQGPVAAAVNALSWQNYLGGVIQYHCGDHPLLMNHAVQIVGYDLDVEIPHYLVRNSWGTEFGHDGYLKIAIGSNLCGIANEVAAVQVT